MLFRVPSLSAVISYARDFMIDRGFTYCVPPFMIRSNVVTGVMSFDEMDAMMYKIEGEDLYLIGTSEHSMIGKFIDTITPESELPKTLTSYSPCFRKEKGAHGIEERGVYRIHQFEKQEMIVVCKPEDSKMWFDKLWKNTVDLFRSLDIPVRTLECCSGDLADLKVKSIDVEAWSPRQKKYFEVGSCSNLGDAQARRLKIRVQDENKNKYFAHTLNNTVVAPPRMLIAFLENNLQADGSVRIPEVLRPYMGVYGLPIGKRIREKFGFPVYVENECNASAVAEKMFGLCRKTEHFMYLSVGNGIGGALFLDGKLYRGAFGAAGEVGSCRMDEIVLKKRSTRKRDTLENLASARGITDIYIKLGGKKKIDGEVPDALTISKMAKEGDALACETFNIEGRYLGQVIASSCMLLNPEKVIIGGGVAMSFNLFKQSLLETVAQEAHIFAMGTPAKIQVTALGYDAGLLGAAAVALQAEGDT